MCIKSAGTAWPEIPLQTADMAVHVPHPNRPSQTHIDTYMSDQTHARTLSRPCLFEGTERRPSSSAPLLFLAMVVNMCARMRCRSSRTERRAIVKKPLSGGAQSPQINGLSSEFHRRGPPLSTLTKAYLTSLHMCI